MFQTYIVYPYTYSPSVMELMFDDYAERKQGREGIFSLSQLYVPRPDYLLDRLRLYPLVPEHELLLQSDCIMRYRGSIGLQYNGYKEMMLQ